MFNGLEFASVRASSSSVPLEDCSGGAGKNMGELGAPWVPSLGFTLKVGFCSSHASSSSVLLEDYSGGAGKNMGELGALTSLPAL